MEQPGTVFQMIKAANESVGQGQVGSVGGTGRDTSGVKRVNTPSDVAGPLKKTKSQADVVSTATSQGTTPAVEAAGPGASGVTSGVTFSTLVDKVRTRCKLALKSLFSSVSMKRVPSGRP